MLISLGGALVKQGKLGVVDPDSMILGTTNPFLLESSILSIFFVFSLEDGVEFFQPDCDLRSLWSLRWSSSQHPFDQFMLKHNQRMHFC